MQVYGIDLSKDKFDVNFLNEKGQETKKTVKNSMAAIGKFLSSVPSGSILCAETTGTYGDLLLFLCNELGVNISFVPGYNIKHSLGLVKGKTDEIDARRIREYGERFFDKLSFKIYQSEQLSELRQLHNLRSQLVKSRKVLKTGDHARSVMPMQSVNTNYYLQSSLDFIDNQISCIEQEMLEIVENNELLAESYRMTVSVKGIGPVIAIELIIKTGNYQDIDSARKAASYAGICPFPNSSGSMVLKTKISPFGDRKLKTLLYMGARAAVAFNMEYKLYYEKKKLEGKPHFVIMNNVSNKLLRTIYSVVESKIPYSQDHVCLDPRVRTKLAGSEKKVAKKLAF